MSSLREKFDPMDLEMIDRVYEVACTYIEARDLCSNDWSRVTEEKAVLRKTVFACASTGPLDFDTLCDKVLANMEGSGTTAAQAHRTS